MNRRTRRPDRSRSLACGAAGALCGLLLSLPSAPAWGAPEGITQIRTSPGALSFVLAAPAGEPRAIASKAEPPRIEIDGMASVMTASGWQLPSRTVWVGIPLDGDVQLSTVSPDRERLQDAGPRLPDLSSRALPSASVKVGHPRWMRNQRVVPIIWTPVVKGAGGAMWERSISVDLRFTGSAVRRTPAVGRDRWEDLYRNLVVNYEQARAWRRAAMPPRKRLAGDYFSTSGANPWIRITVTHGGLYAVTGTDLQTAGVDLGAIAPDKLRLFTGTGKSLPEDKPVGDVPSWLNEVAMRLDGMGDGTFDPQDRILFWGVGPDGWYSDLGLPDANHERYHVDEYSNENSYWLSWGDFSGAPARWTSQDGTPPPGQPETIAATRQHFEQNTIYDARPRDIGDTPPPYPDTLPRWEKFHWLELIASQDSIRSQVPFHITSPVVSEPARLLVRLWGELPSYTPGLHDHYARVDVDQTIVASAAWDGPTRADLVADGLHFASQDAVLGLMAQYKPDNSGNRLDRSYLGWFEIDYKRQLVAQGDTLDFLVEPGSQPRVFSASGLSTQSPVDVIDATDPLHPVDIAPVVQPSGGAYAATWVVQPDPVRTKHMYVRRTDQPLRPGITRVVHPSGFHYLRERTDPIDYILITHASTMDDALRLAQHRASAAGGGLRVAVVDVQDIFDEFSAGRLDPTAIRNFLEFAFENWNGGVPAQAPSYVVLFGNASNDFRDYLHLGAIETVPTYEGYYDTLLRTTVYSPQFGSDDYYVLFGTQPDSTLDMESGRLPVDSPATAAAIVDKLIGYDTSQVTGGWRQRFTLVADDTCQGLNPDLLGFTHMQQTEGLAADLPPELYRDKVYLYEFGTACVYDRKPAATAALRQSIDQGTLVVNFTGHGSEGQLADERVLETPDVASMTNADRLFFFLTASCAVGKFDFAGEGLGEALVRQPGGGAIGVFSSTAVSFSGANAELNRAFFRAVWPQNDVLADRTLGSSSVLAKESSGDPASLNNRRYPLLGDPATRWNTAHLRIDLKLTGHGPGGVARVDTIFRGRLVDLTGTVRDSLGNAQSGYNGTVSFQVYDSQIQRVASPSLTYYLTGATIFRGNAAVTNGQFSTQFQAPAALRTGPRGSAQVYAFAETSDQAAAIGSIPAMPVPEIPPEPNHHQQGPQIQITVAGNLEQLPPNATFQATMSDSTGINITKLVPSRSVLMRIEDGTQLVDLEDLADQVQFPNTYRTGTLSFSLPATLQAGKPYTLTLEASDNEDQRASSSLTFTLVGTSAAGLSLDRIYNIPNPTKGATAFFVEMSQSADVVIRIYTNTGRTIQEIRAGTLSPDQGRAGIPWDGRDKDGDRLANGVYFYKVSIRGDGNVAQSRIERLAVLR